MTPGATDTFLVPSRGWSSYRRPEPSSPFYNCPRSGIWPSHRAPPGHASESLPPEALPQKNYSGVFFVCCKNKKKGGGGGTPVSIV